MLVVTLSDLSHLKGGRGSQVGPDWAMKVRCLASLRLVTFMSVPPWLLEEDNDALKTALGVTCDQGQKTGRFHFSG